DGGLWKLAWRLAPDHQRADDVIWTQQGNDQNAAIALAQDDLVDRRRRLVANVGDLDWPALCRRQPDVAVAKANMLAANRCDHGFAHAVGGMQSELLTFFIEHVDRAGVGVRKLNGPTHDSGEDCLKVQRRVYRLADLAERLQFADRLRQFIRAGTQFMKQPRVLDGDYRLRGEVPDQFNLLVGERTHFLAVDDNCADYIVVFQHRDPDQGARTCEVDSGFAQLISECRGRCYVDQVVMFL